MPNPRRRQQVEHPVENPVAGTQDRYQAQLLAGEQRKARALKRGVDLARGEG
jgi:hypothetical protein